MVGILSKFGSKRLKSSNSINSELSDATPELPALESVAGGWEDLSWRPTTPPPMPDRPAPVRRSSLPSPGTSPSPPGSPVSLRPPAPRQHASSPLAQSISRAELSPKSRFKLPNLLKRSKSGGRDKEAPKTRERETVSPPPAVTSTTASPTVSPPRPKLTLRMRSDSLSRFTRSKSGNSMSGQASSPVSTAADDAEAPFTLKSFRSITHETSTTISPPRSPSLASPEMGPMLRRPSSAYINDPLAIPPPSPSISASQFREARAARSSISLHSRRSTQSLHALANGDGASRPVSRLGLELPTLPAVATTRAPLTFAPPVWRSSSSLDVPTMTRGISDGALTSSPTGSRAASPTPSLALGEPADIRDTPRASSFAIPQPAFLGSAGQERRASLPPGASFGPSVRKEPIIDQPPFAKAQERSASESHTMQVAMTLRERARQWTSSAVIYAQATASAAAAAAEAAKLADTDDEVLDAAVATDSEPESDTGSDVDEDSYEDEKRAWQRHAWNSAGAMEKRADAQQQAVEASKRFNSSFSTLPRHGTPPPIPPPIPAFQQSDRRSTHGDSRTSLSATILPAPSPASLAVPVHSIHVSSSSEDDDDQPLTMLQARRPAFGGHGRSHSMPMEAATSASSSSTGRHSIDIGFPHQPADWRGLGPRPMSPMGPRLRSSPSKPPAVARPGHHQHQHHAWARTSMSETASTLTTPVLGSTTGSESGRSGIDDGPRTPPDVHDRVLARHRADLAVEERAHKRASMSTPPAGVDGALWARLPIDQRIALQLRGEAFMAMLAQQAAAGLYTPLPPQQQAPPPPPALWSSYGGMESPSMALGIGSQQEQDYFHSGPTEVQRQQQ